jgi:hypothetical protein
VGAQGTSDECDDDEGGLQAVFYVSRFIFSGLGREDGGDEDGFANGDPDLG